MILIFEKPSDTGDKHATNGKRAALFFPERRLPHFVSYPYLYTVSYLYTVASSIPYVYAVALYRTSIL